MGRLRTPADLRSSSRFRSSATGRIRGVFVIAAKDGPGQTTVMAGLPSSPTSTPREARKVVFLAFPDVQSLDVTGPVEVFSVASRLLAFEASSDPGYEIEVAAPGRRPFRTSSGLELRPHRGVSRVPSSIDTLVVAGGIGAEAASRDEELVGWVRRTAARARRVTSVCTGALVLGEAGLLDGRRATTHWAWTPQLADRFPGARVEADPIFVRDGSVWTSAGATAGMDLALALVEEDLGHRRALEVARWLVLFMRRPGGQKQFSAQLELQAADRPRVRELLAWIPDHVREDLSVEALARRTCMSPRNFARVFTKEVGISPARFVERTRVEAARRRLEESDESVERIASSCGFGTAETMRRAFLRQIEVNPNDYRAHFRSAQTA